MGPVGSCWRSPSGAERGGDLAAGVDEPAFEFGEGRAVEGRAGVQDQIAAGGDKILVAAKELAQAALGAVALDGVADGGSRGDDAETRRRGGWRIAAEPGERECAAVEAAAVFADRAEIDLAAQMLLGAKTHAEK